MLAPLFRITIKNSTTQTLAQNAVTVYARCWRFNDKAEIIWSDPTLIYTMDAPSLAADGYDSGEAFNNSTTKWLGAVCEVMATSPASSNGDVVIYYEPEGQANQFPTNGLGKQMCRINFTTAGTKQRMFEI
jgi:hypothetical protein